MKTLEEKKLLVKMARAFGQPVDQSLVESIEKEERLSKILFKETAQPEPVKIVEEKVETPQVLAEIVVEPPKPAPAFVAPIANTTNAALNILHTATVKPQATAPTPTSQREVEILRRQIAEIMQKITTLSWGGGGTGIVRIWDADDFDRATAGENRVMKFRDDGWFYLEKQTGLENSSYASFSDTTDQTANVANTAYEVRFNTTDIASGHYLRNNTEIVCNTAGVFNYQFSLQFVSTSSSVHDAYIWIRKNNVDVPNTATIITFSSNKQYGVAAWNYFVDMEPGDHIHLMWAASDARVSIVAPPATAFCPAVPSAIMTVSQVSATPV